MIRRQSHSLARLALFIAGAVIVFAIGWWDGYPFVMLSVYAMLVACWQLWQRGRLQRWVESGERQSLDMGWSDVASVIDRRRRRERSRTRRVASWLRWARDAASSFTDGMVLLDSDFRIEWVNDAAVRMLDLDVAHDTGQRVTNFVRHPDVIDQLLRDADAEQLVIDSRAEEGRLLGLESMKLLGNRHLLVIRDVTELEHAEAARRDFVANASHELRSPLTVIRGYLDGMRDDPEIDVTWHEPLAEMTRQSNRMSDLLRDLLDLSRLDRLYRSAELTPIDMSALLVKVCEDARSSAAGGRRLVIDAEPGLALLGDRPEVVLVLSNLLSNAIRYTRDGGIITARWIRHDDGAALLVEDDGIGIHADDIPRITERFYRVDKGRSRQGGGTGLGLAIVRSALERHGATLEVTSEIDKGSVFSCIFPAERVVVEPIITGDRAIGHG